MPSNRDVLAQLSKAELLTVVDRFELSVADRRVRDGLIEALGSSKKVTLAEMLAESRARLVGTTTNAAPASEANGSLKPKVNGSATPRPSSRSGSTGCLRRQERYKFGVKYVSVRDTEGHHR
jgi:hypothetical protein